MNQATLLAGFIGVASKEETEATQDLGFGQHELSWIELAGAVGNGNGLIDDDQGGMEDHAKTCEGGFVIGQHWVEVADGEFDERFHGVTIRLGAGYLLG